uniref:Uncharacterized protein n=1 Tax=Picea sitchensis TaxID=3332 RepID=A9NMD1_PICSI|nr:unknown [Picea sitchensis]
MNSWGKLFMITFVATVLLMGKANAAFEAQIEYEDAAASFGSPLPMSGVNTFCSAPSFGHLAWTLISLAIYTLL